MDEEAMRAYYTLKWPEVTHTADVETAMTVVKVGKALTSER
jgi:hypothetical protein